MISPNAGEHRLPVIIDTDPGVDDAIALLIALADPRLDILGLTTVAGNIPRARATRNALALLDFVGHSQIPVHPGAARPVQGRFPYATNVHSPSGLTRPIPDPVTPPAATPAVPFLRHALKDQPDAITIIALGPLTNLARLHLQHPDALRRARRIVIMGGAVAVPGNVTPDAEFNFHSDPTAAQIVFAAGLPVTLIDLAPCRQVYLNRSDAANLRAANPLGQLAAQLLGGWFRKDQQRQRFNLYDPLALLAATDEGLFAFRNLTLEVVAPTNDRDPARWGSCRIIDPSRGPTAIAPPEQIDQTAARQAIADRLGWQ